uniref:NIDO domain-containing protein n=1 Tax=Panagrolaimus sp. JU765 TaxID=591449 RepID=A0AC34Q918_9BILA
MVVATDEIRTYCMFNFANINWTSSATAGAVTGGRGGKQSALVGFNGGNGTGYFELPYSAEGNSYKLVQYGSTQIAGRWLARIDEQIQYGGCSNESRGTLETSQQYGNMLGGFALN